MQYFKKLTVSCEIILGQLPTPKFLAFNFGLSKKVHSSSFKVFSREFLMASTLFENSTMTLFTLSSAIFSSVTSLSEDMSLFRLSSLN